MIPLETRMQALATEFDRLGHVNNRAHIIDAAEVLFGAAMALRADLKQWERDNAEPPKPSSVATLFPDGLPLRWYRGVHQAMFNDAFHSDCLISEGLDDRRVVYLGRTGHMMALTQSMAQLLAPILQRFGDTGQLPVPEVPTLDAA